MTAGTPDVDRSLAQVQAMSPSGPAVRTGPGAVRAVPGLVAAPAGAVVALLAESVPIRGGEGDVRVAVKDALSEAFRVQPVHLPGGRSHADAATVDAAVEACRGADALVTVGSGTLTDIGKVAAHRLGISHVVVQTALSVNGYADDQSVLLVDGVKRTVPTRFPDALVADTDVLLHAPPGLNAAGVGELLAMFTAPTDWQLAAELGMGPAHQPDLVRLLRDAAPGVLAAAPGLAARDPAAVAWMAKALTLTGAAMGAAGTTAPSSGAEHTVSHLVEMAATRRGATPAWHGAQVGVATVLAALVWQRVPTWLADPCPGFPTDDEAESSVLSAFADLDPSGAMGRECWTAYRRKLNLWRRQRLLPQDDRWARVAALAAGVPPPRTLVAALRAADAPTRFGDLDPPVDAATARWALRHCHLMRERFTVVDLAFLLGRWTDSTVESILAAAAGLGAGL